MRQIASEKKTNKSFGNLATTSVELHELRLEPEETLSGDEKVYEEIQILGKFIRCVEVNDPEKAR